MKTLGKIIIISAIITSTFAGCQGAEECSGPSCESLNTVDSTDTQKPGVGRFEIEIIGEGQVLVNEEPCTTANGICSYEMPIGSVVSLLGEFDFTSETGEGRQEGRCEANGGCQLVLGRSGVHVVASLE